MSMITGRRRPCLILIQTYSKVDGPYGATKTWATDRTVWVNLEPKRGFEQYKANEVESVVTHVIRGDYYDLDGVTPQMRVIYAPTMDYGGSPVTIPNSAKVYQIHAVIADENERGDTMLRVEEEGRNYGEIIG
jgi:SPP1 family predicted phage head-tail adaptor